MNADRVAAYAFHGMIPLIYDGTARTVTLAAWLHDMEAIFRICHIEDHLQVPLATRCLARDARAWWRAIGEAALLGGSWEEFRALIIARYGPIPDRDAAMPYRDQVIYDNMNFERYLTFVADWRAYPDETMSHYCRRFQEAMLPHIPNIGDPELRALQILRNGVPAGIRAYVPIPMPGMTVEGMTNDIMDAEATVHMIQVDALINDDGQEPNDDIDLGAPPLIEDQVVPEDLIPTIPLQVLPPYEEEIVPEVDNMNIDDLPDDLEEEFEDPPEIDASDNEGGDEENVGDFEDDPEEIPFDDEDREVFSDASTE